MTDLDKIRAIQRSRITLEEGGPVTAKEARKLPKRTRPAPVVPTTRQGQSQAIRESRERYNRNVRLGRPRG
jgi:hypothetical protein